MKRIAVLSNAIPDAWLAPCGAEVVREVEYARYTPVPLRAGMCAHLAYLPALLEDVDGIVLATSCDQMRRGAEWLDDAQRVFLFDVPSAPCDALLRLERARLERWVLALPSQKAAQAFLPAHQTPATQTGMSAPLCIGILGGHFCGNAASVRDFFAQRAIHVGLWGCEGGERLGDICQRPNDDFHERLARAVRERNLAGLVVTHTTWCDVWRAAYTRIQETAAVPVTEWVFDGLCDGQPFPDARSVTRLEAFCELLATRKQEVR